MKQYSSFLDEANVHNHQHQVASYCIALKGKEGRRRGGGSAWLLTEECDARVERLDLVRGADEGHDLGRDGAGHPLPGVRRSHRQPP